MLFELEMLVKGLSSTSSASSTYSWNLSFSLSRIASMASGGLGSFVALSGLTFVLFVIWLTLFRDALLVWSTENEQVVRANMQIREGGDFDEVILDRDIRSLYRTGLFELVEIKYEPVDQRTLNIVVEVTPKFRVLAIHFEGNTKVKTTRLEK